MYCAGIDAGSRTIKIVLTDTATNAILDRYIADQSVQQKQLISDMYNDLIAANNIKPAEVAYVVATGYGRDLVDFADTTITEITCHGAGIHHLLPQVRTIIDIGGQDSKIIKLDPDGKVRDFAMNDRCAAGTGCFLEIVSDRLETPFESFQQLVRKSCRPALISNMCVVFAETEIIGLLASGSETSEIITGVQKAIADRIASMTSQVLQGPLCFTGGVALVPGMAEALEKSLDLPVQIAPHCQFTGAIGAAIIASQRLIKKNAS